MKTYFLLLLTLPFARLSKDMQWTGDLEAAFRQATSEKKYVLLNFSGSDWCGPCIRMHREIFETEAFGRLALERLILVQADFPRQKKNQPEPAQVKRNEAMAEKYNPNGIFPLTVLLDQNGKVLLTREGFYKDGADAFAALISSKLGK
jgi:thioredoxin-related protein